MKFPETNRDIDLIERYLDGELTFEEQQSFDKRMIDDPVFKDLVGARKESSELWLKARTYYTVKEEVNRIHKMKFSHKKNILRIVPSYLTQHKYYSIAAIGILLIALIAALLFIVRPSQKFKIADNDRNKIYDVRKAIKPAEKGEIKIYKYDLNNLLKPDNGEVISRNKVIRFEWRCFDNSDRYLFITKRGEELPVFSRLILCPKSFMLLPAGTLKPGVYTWYVTDEKFQRTFTIK